jgi:RecB family exonuclease
MELAPAQLRIPSGPVESAGSRSASAPRIHLSFSAINAYLSCPLRYRLAYEDELAVPTWYFVQFGASLHRTLEAIHRRALRREQVDDQAAAMLLDHHWVAFGSRSPDAEERLKATAREYVARYVRHHASSFSRIREVELVFSAETGSALVSGRVDLVREAEDGSLEIVDFKTRASGGLALTHADLQLHLYALACEDRLEGRVGHVTVHLLADDVVERFPWDDRGRQRVQETLDRVVAGIASRDFPPAPRIHCQACEFRQLCPYGEA